MPLYEYRCGTCGSFELIRRFSDPPLELCPTCTGPIEKLLSAPAFQFKGTGWYVTDYGRKDGSDESKQDRESKREDASKKESDSKKEGESKKDSSVPSSSSSSTAETKSAGSSDSSSKPAAPSA